MTDGRLRVGTDLVEVAAVVESIEQFGVRYLERVFTDGELATCRDGSGWSAARLAARFAAKEATVKVLRPVEGMSYDRIEVVLDDDGAPDLRFHGSALRRADEIGFRDSSLSLSHDGGYALAILAAVVN